MDFWTSRPGHRAWHRRKDQLMSADQITTGLWRLTSGYTREHWSRPEGIEQGCRVCKCLMVTDRSKILLLLKLPGYSLSCNRKQETGNCVNAPRASNWRTSGLSECPAPTPSLPGADSVSRGSTITHNVK